MGIKNIFSLTVFSLPACLLSAHSGYFNFGSPYDLSLNRDLIGITYFIYDDRLARAFKCSNNK